MQLKRILSAALTLLFVFPLLTVSAHPGRTDKQGGHTDADTGDYHYHHGYPAHDHYDIDGNGLIDCPYDFDDKTGENSGESSGGNSGSNWYTGTNWSGITSSDATHETSPRLDWMLGNNESTPVDTDPATEPTTPTQISSFPEETLWDAFCNLVGDEGTARLIATSTIVMLISVPTYYLANRFHLDKISRFSAPIAFMSALVPGFIVAYIFCGLIVVFSILALLWFILRGTWKWVKELFRSKTTPLVINTTFPNDVKADSQSTEPVIQSFPSSKRQTTKSHKAYKTSPASPQILHTSDDSFFRESNTELPVVTQPPLPPQTFTKPDPDVDFRLVLMPETEVSAHTRCRDTCRYLWYETLMLRSSTTPPISSDACVYLWTAMFYTAVKTLRNQASVDRIYSYFAEITAEFVTEDQYTTLVIAKVRDTYRSLRHPLNASGIDPRSGNGRLALWNLLISINPELLQHSDIRKGFLDATERIWKMIGDVFPQSHPYPKSGEVQYSLDDFPKE